MSFLGKYKREKKKVTREVWLAARSLTSIAPKKKKTSCLYNYY
jgi:hypothetical protein